MMPVPADNQKTLSQTYFFIILYTVLKACFLIFHIGLA